MKTFGKKIYGFILPAILLVGFDEWIKSVALKSFPDEKTLVDPDFLNFAIHKNFGLAFDIPFRHELILLISLVIGFFLLQIVWKNVTRHPDIAFSSILILIGALGNVYDRIVYGFTVDYIIFFGRTALNLSDLMIVLGVVILLLASRRTANHKLIHPDEPNEV